MMTMRMAFSWTCQPNMKAERAQRTMQRTKCRGLPGQRHSFTKHGYQHKPKQSLNTLVALSSESWMLWRFVNKRGTCPYTPADLSRTMHLSNRWCIECIIYMRIFSSFSLEAKWVKQIHPHHVWELLLLNILKQISCTFHKVLFLLKWGYNLI